MGRIRGVEGTADLACLEHSLAWGRGSRERAEKERPQRLCWGAWVLMMPPVNNESRETHSLVYLIEASPEWPVREPEEAWPALLCTARHKTGGGPSTPRNQALLVLLSRSVAQSCPTLCNPMDHSMPGFLVHHQLLELAQTHVH